MANSGSNHWSQSFRPHVDIQDAWELSQDPETHNANPPSAKVGLVAHAVNEAVLRHRAQRAAHGSWIDQNPNRGLISAGYASQWQQAHMAQKPQQTQQQQQQQPPSWGQKGPQGGQMQQPHWAQQQQQQPPL